MDKLKPTYDLDSVKAEFATVEGLRMTVSARNSAFSLGLTLEDVVRLVQMMSRAHFYKSMTSHADHTIWQDVYHVPYAELLLYVKLTIDIDGHIVISLKEK